MSGMESTAAAWFGRIGNQAVNSLGCYRCAFAMDRLLDRYKRNGWKRVFQWVRDTRGSRLADFPHPKT